MTAAELSLIAAAVPTTTVLVGDVCTTSVVATVPQCSQAVPGSIAVATTSTPDAFINCWGTGVQRAIVSKCAATAAGVRALGLTLPAGLAANPVLQVLVVDRSDATGNSENGQPLSLMVPGPSPTGRLTVLVYSGADTAGVDLTSIGGTVTPVSGGFLLTSPHSSTFVALAADAPTTATTPSAGTAQPAAADNGWWIGLAVGLGVGIPVLLLLLAGIAYAVYYWWGPSEPAPAPYYPPPPTSARHRAKTPHSTPAYPSGWVAVPPPTPLGPYYP
eukprot:EG_transcript_4622